MTDIESLAISQQEQERDLQFASELEHIQPIDEIKDAEDEEYAYYSEHAPTWLDLNYSWGGK